MNLVEMMKKAQNLQAGMQSMKAELDAQVFEGVAGGSMVKVTLMGTGKLTKVEINPSLMAESETEILQDLIVAAVNNAQSERRTYRAEKMQEMTAGLPIPPGMMNGM